MVAKITTIQNIVTLSSPEIAIHNFNRYGKSRKSRLRKT